MIRAALKYPISRQMGRGRANTYHVVPFREGKPAPIVGKVLSHLSGGPVIERKRKSFFSPRDPGAVHARFMKVVARAEQRADEALRSITPAPKKPLAIAKRLTLRAKRSPAPR
jgi:hypothetical protein